MMVCLPGSNPFTQKHCSLLSTATNPQSGQGTINLKAWRDIASTEVAAVNNSGPLAGQISTTETCEYTYNISTGATTEQKACTDPVVEFSPSGTSKTTAGANFFSGMIKETRTHSSTATATSLMDAVSLAASLSQITTIAYYDSGATKSFKMENIKLSKASEASEAAGASTLAVFGAAIAFAVAF